MKAKRFILCVALAFLAGDFGLFCYTEGAYLYPFKRGGWCESRADTAAFRTVRVSGDRDTDVVLPMLKREEKYTIGYITHGMTEKIRLERGRWYSVAGNGNLTVKPINVRVE